MSNIVAPPGPTGPPGAQGQPGICPPCPASQQLYFGTFADPNGNVVGNPNDFYKNTDTGEFWVKQTGINTDTGWLP